MSMPSPPVLLGRSRHWCWYGDTAGDRPDDAAGTVLPVTEFAVAPLSLGWRNRVRADVDAGDGVAGGGVVEG
jgi:hypothetical protein